MERLKTPSQRSIPALGCILFAAR